MRKPRDFDAELGALEQKARSLRQRKVMQLGELVIATGADQLPIDMLAGALLAAVGTDNAATKEGWQKAGTAMFQGKAEQARSNARSNGAKSSSIDRGTQPPSGEPQS